MLICECVPCSDATESFVAAFIGTGDQPTWKTFHKSRNILIKCQEILDKRRIEGQKERTTNGLSTARKDQILDKGPEVWQLDPVKSDTGIDRYVSSEDFHVAFS